MLTWVNRFIGKRDAVPADETWQKVLRGLSEEGKAGDLARCRKEMCSEVRVRDPRDTSKFYASHMCH